MSANAYEILGLGMRYVFAGLMLLIVLRAWRITAIDAGRARRLRRLSPETGIIGEMLVVDGGERARTGMRYPVTLEGAIGSARRADIRVRHRSVRARHAIYQMTQDGLFIRGHANARIRDGLGRARRELLLGDGDVFFVGGVRLMLVLSDGGGAPEEIERRVRRRRSGAESMRRDPDDDFFAPQGDPDDDLFAPQGDPDDDLFAPQGDPDDDLFAPLGGAPARGRRNADPFLRKPAERDDYDL